MMPRSAMNPEPTEQHSRAGAEHMQAFVFEEADSKSLHFTLHQLQSRMRTSQPNGLVLDYTRTMMGFLLLHRHPRHIAMIGLGGGSLAKFCRQHLPRSRFTAVEINPHVIALRKDFFIPEDDDYFRIVEADGADFVQGLAGEIDVLLVDGYDHLGQSAQLSSQKFYDDCKRALSANGVLAINFHRAHPLHARFVDRLNQTFSGNLAEVLVGKDGNAIVFARGDQKIYPDALRTEIAAACGDWSGWIAQHA